MVFDLGGLLAALVGARIRFVVIGAIAVAAHAIVRATEDIDIVPEPSAPNLDELCNVLLRLDARLLADPNRSIDVAIGSALRRGRNLTVTTSLGDLDVVQRLPGIPSYEALDAEAWEADLSAPDFACVRVSTSSR